MAVNHANTLLAIGCDDGDVRIFEILDDGLSLIKSYNRKESKVTSIAWDNEDKHIVFGTSDGAIIKWNVEQGNNNKKKEPEVQLINNKYIFFSKGNSNRMTTEQKVNIVWAVQVLK